MPVPNPEALDFLLTRRSRPAKTLGDAGPDAAELNTLLTAAARTPDHGKLVPWRFIVIGKHAQADLSAKAMRRSAALGLEPAQAEKTANAFLQGAVIVAVVASPQDSEKIPRWEQELSAGAVCLALLNAALAAGWGANWLTGPLARDPEFTTAALGCSGTEFVAGFIHIGNETIAPADRPRPDLPQLITHL